MSEPSSQTIAGLLAEGDRLRVFAALVLGATTTDDVIGMTALDSRSAGAALARLAAAGLVEQDRHGFRVVEEAIRAAAREAGVARARAEDEHDTDAGVPKAMRPFIRHGRIVHFPTARPKMRELLDLISQDFEPGQHYGEREANEILSRWSDDVATLRRYLVDEGFLDREGGGGTYWRTGGTVPV